MGSSDVSVGRRRSGAPFWSWCPVLGGEGSWVLFLPSGPFVPARSDVGSGPSRTLGPPVPEVPGWTSGPSRRVGLSASAAIPSQLTVHYGVAGFSRSVPDLRVRATVGGDVGESGWVGLSRSIPGVWAPVSFYLFGPKGGLG